MWHVRLVLLMKTGTVLLYSDCAAAIYMLLLLLLLQGTPSKQLNLTEAVEGCGGQLSQMEQPVPSELSQPLTGRCQRSTPVALTGMRLTQHGSAVPSLTCC